MESMLCFSHLKWDFVYQRPQHLMSRFASLYKLYYLEEPCAGSHDSFTITQDKDVFIVKLYLSSDEENYSVRLQNVIDQFIVQEHVINYNCWYYTPMALAYTGHLKPKRIIYDCMDELSAFKFAPSQLLPLEKMLFERAHIVFTGGNSLFEAKKHLHHNIYSFPSSIDKDHFMSARLRRDDPHDQKLIPRPRLGFYGVIDERFDIALLKSVSALRPEWHFVIIGPVVKIDNNELPKEDNIHYLGIKDYQELPSYVGQWDIAMVLFALNESTRFISPTKTPEYLAAGIPVISTPIKDVEIPYGQEKLVHIAENANAFIIEAESELKENERSKWLKKVDEFLKDKSWTNTFHQMNDLITKA